MTKGDSAKLSKECDLTKDKGTGKFCKVGFLKKMMKLSSEKTAI